MSPNRRWRWWWSGEVELEATDSINDFFFPFCWNMRKLVNLFLDVKVAVDMLM